MQHLIPFREYLSANIPQLTDDKLNLLIISGQYEAGNSHYTLRVLILDYRADPYSVIIPIKRWLASVGRDKIYNADIKISFECEVIDKASYDLEIDIPMLDRIADSGIEYHVCPPQVWDEGLQMFISAST